MPKMGLRSGTNPRPLKDGVSPSEEELKAVFNDTGEHERTTMASGIGFAWHNIE